LKEQKTKKAKIKKSIFKRSYLKEHSKKPKYQKQQDQNQKDQKQKDQKQKVQNQKIKDQKKKLCLRQSFFLFYFLAFGLAFRFCLVLVFCFTLQDFVLIFCSFASSVCFKFYSSFLLQSLKAFF
jgi:cation transport ATPase